MITDVEDEESWTKPADWYDAIVAAKGDPNEVVMLAIQPQALVGEKSRTALTMRVGISS